MAEEKDASELDPEKETENVKKATEQMMSDLATNIYKDIIDNSPVDTGFSRANWNVSLGEPDYEVHVGDMDTHSEEDSFDAPEVPTIPANPDLKDIWIANGVPYIGLLEEGESDQAPQGFVATAIERETAKAESGSVELTEGIPAET
jgi:hypothetical protein